MIVIVMGDREWPYPAFVRGVMNSLYVQYNLFILYHGDCRDRGGNPCGADHHANEWARSLHGMTVRPRPADWTRYKKAAGPIRNRDMIQEALAEAGSLDNIRYEAFRRPHSKGTNNAIKICKGYDIPGRVWDEKYVMQYESLTYARVK